MKRGEQEQESKSSHAPVWAPGAAHCKETRGDYTPVFSISINLCFVSLRRGVSWTLELEYFGCLTINKPTRVFCLSLQCWGWKAWARPLPTCHLGAGIQTHFLTVVHQTLLATELCP